MIPGNPNGQVWIAKDIKKIHPVARSTDPYPYELIEKVSLEGGNVLSGRFREVIYRYFIPKDSVSIGCEVLSGSFKSIVLYATHPKDIVNITQIVLSGNFNSVVRYYDAGKDTVTLTHAVVSGFLDARVVLYTRYATEKVNLRQSVVGGSFDDLS